MNNIENSLRLIDYTVTVEEAEAIDYTPQVEEVQFTELFSEIKLEIIKHIDEASLISFAQSSKENFAEVKKFRKRKFYKIKIEQVLSDQGYIELAKYLISCNWSLELGNIYHNAFKSRQFLFENVTFKKDIPHNGYLTVNYHDGLEFVSHTSDILEQIGLSCSLTYINYCLDHLIENGLVEKEMKCLDFINILIGSLRSEYCNEEYISELFKIYGNFLKENSKNAGQTSWQSYILLVKYFFEENRISLLKPLMDLDIVFLDSPHYPASIHEIMSVIQPRWDNEDEEKILDLLKLLKERKPEVIHAMLKRHLLIILLRNLCLKALKFLYENFDCPKIIFDSHLPKEWIKDHAQRNNRPDVISFILEKENLDLM